MAREETVYDLPPEALNLRLGLLLRAERTQRGLTLVEVERRTLSHVRASVLSAYERGKRTVSENHLQSICNVYDIDPAELLLKVQRPGRSSNRVVIDLTKLEASDDPPLRAMIQRLLDRRTDGPRRFLEVRLSEIRAAASQLNVEPILASWRSQGIVLPFLFPREVADERRRRRQTH